MVTDPPYGVELRPGLAQHGRAVGDEAHRQGAERRPGGLARGLGAVPRRGRLRLARRAARHHRRREPGGLRLRHPLADHLGQGAAGALPRRLPLAARALLVRGREKGKGHWNGDRKQTTLWSIPSRDQDASDRARHPEAGRVHAPADAEQQLARPGGVRALLRIGDARSSPPRPAAASRSRWSSTRPTSMSRCCAGRPSPGRRRRSTATAAASPRSPPSGRR